MSAVRGWCPGALRPMASGDGWVVRVKPPGGRLSAAQVAGLAQAALRHGNGLIDLTGRANLQLRGVREAIHAPLIDALRGFGLIDPDLATETRRNIIVTPFADATTDRLASDLAAALAASDLALPAKFGFAVDTGPVPVLIETPADIRIERDASGALILRADGMGKGEALTDLAQVIGLARWFLERGGMRDGRGRMATLIGAGITPQAGCRAQHGLTVPVPGRVRQGVLVALEFGQIEAGALAALGPLRLTPWRMLLLEGRDIAPNLPGLILDPGDPRLRLRACTGAPGCAQAHSPTRPLARSLAAHLPPGAILHVSGCAKGCGWPHPADLTLTATPEGFDLIRAGRAGDPPHLRGLSTDQLPQVL